MLFSPFSLMLHRKMAIATASKYLKSIKLSSPSSTIVPKTRFLQSEFFSADAKSNQPPLESADDFESSLFGSSRNSGEGDINRSFYKSLVWAQGQMSNLDLRRSGGRNDGNGAMGFLDTSVDGVEGRLKEAATFFKMTDEVMQEDYAFRPDVTFTPRNTYKTKDLDLKKPGVEKGFKRKEFETTTKEVLKKADFRNVRFLANFLTDSGIITKRSQTKISAKAQRKVAREIKTARALGLLPFTLMGKKQFVVGKSMHDRDDDYYYDANYENADDVVEPEIEP